MKTNVIKFSLISILLSLSIHLYSVDVQKEKFIHLIDVFVTENRIQEIRNSKFTIELLFEYIELKYPKANKICIKQFILETGWFTSNIFKVNNNICGMKFPKTRETTAKETKNNHASYTTVWDSVDDYFLFLKYYSSKGAIKKQATDTEYYAFLDSIGYAEASSYIKILKQIKIKRV